MVQANKAKPKAVVVWFKRDLRLHDHAPLAAAAASGLPVIPLYVVEPAYWAQPFASRRQWCFIHDCLTELRADLAQLGQPLVVRQGQVTDVLQVLQESAHIEALYAHEETGNGWTFRRDIAVLKFCKTQGIVCHESPANGVVRRLKSRDDWAKIRHQRMAQPVVAKPQQLKPFVGLALGDIPPKDDKIFGNDAFETLQKGGRREAVKVLASFLEERGSQYLYHISKPEAAQLSCMRLSPYLTWGSLSVREVLKALQSRKQKLPDGVRQKWQRHLSAVASRLSWRCHFVQKLEDQPAIETHAMHSAFENIRQVEATPEAQAQYAQRLEAWQKGQTGYPLIDACMRHLQKTGWLTFRMRAMVTSFASYHLWLDWRDTGKHLARMFTDYEPGIHYSQLQMQSGVTGINAIRMYNPTKQAQDHDPEGRFIKTQLPELQNIPLDWLFEPWHMPPDLQQKYGCMIGQDYPEPIVDHATAMRHARAKLAEARAAAGFKTTAKAVYQKLGSRRKPVRRKVNANKTKHQPEASQQLSFLIETTKGDA